MMHRNWFGNGYCPLFGGYGTFNFWHILVMIGVVIVVIGFIMMSKKNNKSENSLELLKIQYIEGKLTEEEYLNRKNVIERK